MRLKLAANCSVRGETCYSSTSAGKRSGCDGDEGDSYHD